MRIGGRPSLRARTYVRATEDSLAPPILSLSVRAFFRWGSIL